MWYAFAVFESDYLKLLKLLTKFIFKVKVICLHDFLHIEIFVVRNNVQ